MAKKSFNIYNHDLKIRLIDDNIDKIIKNASFELSNKRDLDLDAEKRIEEIKRYRQDTDLKKLFAIFVIIFVSIWSVLVIVFMFLVYFFAKQFPSDVFWITLLGTNLTQVIGLSYFVVNHLFPKSYKD